MSFYGLLILQKTNFKLASKLFVTVKKKTIAKAIVFFSYIRLRRVIFLRSDIRLKPSDIALRAVIGEYNITETAGFNITFAKRKYHCAVGTISLRFKTMWIRTTEITDYETIDFLRS